MAYTRTPWDPTTPAGSAQVSAGDNEIRAIKQDILERLESFFEDIDADPLVPKASAIDALTVVTGKKLIIGPHSGNFTADNDEWARSDTYVWADLSGPAFRREIPLPVGCTITNIKVYVERVLGTSIECKIKSVTLGVTPVSADEWAVTETDAGIQEVDSGVLSLEILDTKHYFLQVNGNDTYRFYSAIVTYDSPGLSAVR